MNAPNVELLDYNWGYRKLAVANIEIAQLKVEIAAITKERNELLRDNAMPVLDRLVAEGKTIKDQAATIARLTKTVALADALLFSYSSDGDCISWQAHEELKTAYQIIKQENDSAK